MSRTDIPQRIRGTQDLFGEEMRRHGAVLAAFERVRALYGFQHAEVPVIEPTAVFARSLGETTDVVSKEMYSFDDRGGDSITLRPEFTAGLSRAYLGNGWQQYAPLKLVTHGPVFRYERPQKGRYRQFHQLDAEVIGAAEPAADIELLVMADQLLRELGIAAGVTLQLNTLGDQPTRDAWRAALVAHFEANRGALSKDSLARLEKNPLRILDSKDAGDRPIADAAPGIDNYLSSEAGTFFEAVAKGLDAAGVAWTRNAGLVRGLDYYRHTAFEFITDRLGAQGTVLAGGRYDGLIEALGGPATPAVGWAAGVERLAMLIEAPAAEFPAIVVVPEHPDAELDAQGITAALRRRNISVDIAYRGNAKRRFELAKKSGARMQLSVLPAPHDMIHLRYKAFGSDTRLDRQQFDGLLAALSPQFPLQENLISDEEAVFKAHVSRQAIRP